MATLRKFLRSLSLLGFCVLIGGSSLFGTLAQGKPEDTISRQSASGMAGAGRITATFHGLQGHNGYLRVSLYDTSRSFPDGTPAARRDILLPTIASAASLDMLSVTFDDLPSGTYAVCAFHDRSGSGKLTQNFLGIPQEEWGMSGNPHPKFRAPRFDEAKLGLAPRETKTISITLRQ